MQRLAVNPSAEPVISTYLHAKAKKNKIPLTGTFELTSRCNFNCKMCYIHTAACNQKSNELPAQWWIEIGKKAVEEGMLFLLLTGGEPLLREDFPYIYTELRKLGLIISINTNGYLLQGEIAELFKNNPPHRINVSLYGASDDTYEKLTGVRGFSTVIQNIKKMKSYGIDMRLNCSLTKENADDMLRIYEISKSLDLHIKTTSYMYPSVRANDSIGQNDSRLDAKTAAACRVAWSILYYGEDEFIRRAKMIKQGFSMFDDCCNEEAEPSKIRCRAGSSTFWLNHDGVMSLCGMIGNGYDVKKIGFSKAWDLVVEHASKITLPAKCSTCKYQQLCHVCAAVCYTETGDFTSVSDYVCHYCEETARLTQIELERYEKNL